VDGSIRPHSTQSNTDFSVSAERYSAGGKADLPPKALDDLTAKPPAPVP
jgi:hypothetical protein